MLYSVTLELSLEVILLVTFTKLSSPTLSHFMLFTLLVQSQCVRYLYNLFLDQKFIRNIHKLSERIISKTVNIDQPHHSAPSTIHQRASNYCFRTSTQSHLLHLPLIFSVLLLKLSLFRRNSLQ